MRTCCRSTLRTDGARRPRPTLEARQRDPAGPGTAPGSERGRTQGRAARSRKPLSYAIQPMVSGGMQSNTQDPHIPWDLNGNCGLCTEHGQLAAWPSTSEGRASAKFFPRSMLAHRGIPAGVGHRANQSEVTTRPELAGNGPAVPPARRASALAMQLPVASAEATSVSTLSPVLARPGAPPRSR